YGFPKLRQLLIAIGLAPLQTTFRAASATAIFPPFRGFKYTYRPLQSVFIARALSVPLMRTTPESEAPGPFTVFVPDTESYYSYTHRLYALFADPSRILRIFLWS